MIQAWGLRVLAGKQVSKRQWSKGLEVHQRHEEHSTLLRGRQRGQEEIQGADLLSQMQAENPGGRTRGLGAGRGPEAPAAGQA